MENWLSIFGIAVVLVVIYFLYRLIYCKHRWEARNEAGVYPVWYCARCGKKKK